VTIKTLGIDHVHFNVNRLKHCLDLLRQLFGPDITPTSFLQDLHTYNACVSFPGGPTQSFMDMFQAADDSSHVADHIRRHGQGVSHVAFRVDDIDSAAAHAIACGLRQTSSVGYRGMRQVQFDTYDVFGFQLEFVEYEPGYAADLEAVKARLRAGETVDGLRYVDL